MTTTHILVHKKGIYFILSYAARSKPNDNFHTFSDICIQFNVFPADVCKGIISRVSPELKFILNRANFDVNEFCAMVILNDDCMGSGKSMDWEVKLPSIPKPPPNNTQLPKENLPSFKVLQVTDTHYDPLYAEGSNAVCKEPLCCRDKSQIVLKNSDGAGKWGDYRNCDPPKAMIDNMFDHIVEVHAVSEIQFCNVLMTSYYYISLRTSIISFGLVTYNHITYGAKPRKKI